MPKLAVVAVRVLMTLAVSMAIILSSSCSRPPSEKSLEDYNLIVIVIDALRADHLGCYDYSRDTSPFIDSLAAQGVLFERAMSNSSFTRETVSVLMSGMLSSRTGAMDWTAHPPTGIANLGELYRQAQYRTGFFSNQDMLTDPRFTEGFDEFAHLANSSRTSRGGPRLSARALDFVRSRGDRKFMMYLHYLDPHAPYNPPRSFYLRYADSVFPEPIMLYGEVRQRCAELIREGFGPGEARFDDLVLRYDAEIAHTDRAIEMLFEGLEQLGVLDDTLVVVTADHGEEFLEHSFVEHAWTLYNESLHVPLIFWAPGVLDPERHTAMVSTVDLLPTLLSLMDVPHAGREFDGSALFEGQGSDLVFVPPTKPFIAELLIQHRSLLRAVIEDDWKYIAARKWLTPESRPEVARNLAPLVMMYLQDAEKRLDVWGPVVHEELFNLAEDPQEKRNLLRDAPETRAKLRAVLEDLKRKGRLDTGAPVQDEAAPMSPEEAERLRALGYL